MSGNRRQNRGRTSDYFIVYDLESGAPVGRLLDLSTTGARLMTDEPVDVPVRMSCRMALPDYVEGSREVRFEAETRWCQHNKVTGWHESGIEFTHLTDLAVRVIDRLVREFMDSEDIPQSNPTPFE
jgi:hypothetical protein